MKIIRAYEHLKALNAEVDRTLGHQLNSVVAEVEPESGDKVYRAQMGWEPPAEWGLILGDCVHNLRSALDHMVWDLVTLNGGTPDSNTEFPIYRDSAQYGLKHEAVRKLKGVAADASQVIEEAQPYHGPEPIRHPLWVLRELDIIDKHRTILLTLPIFQVGHYRWWGDMPEGGEPIHGGVVFEDQGEIFRIPARTYADKGIKPEFVADVALDIAGPLPGSPLRRVTTLLYGVVSRQLHYMEYKVLGVSPFATHDYPHVSDVAPTSAKPPPCRVVERS